MSKLIWLIPALLLILIFSIYLLPTPNKSFETLSSDVPEEQLLLYQGFKGTNTHRMVIQGESWEVFVVGPKTAEPILFLHGMTGEYDIWWQQIVALRSNFRIISVTFPPIESLDALSQGIIRILDSQNVQKTNLVGTSMGGYLAQYLIAAHPERFIRAVLSNTFPPNDIIRQNNAVIGRALPFLPEWYIMRTLRGSLFDSVFPAAGDDEFTKAYLLSMVSGKLTKSQVLARYRTIIESFTPLEPLSQGIAVMIIESENDPLVEDTLREQLNAVYPFSFKYTFSDAGHFPYLNRPEEFTTQLIKFFSMPIME